MWLVFEVISIGYIRPISLPLDNKEDAESFVEAMRGTIKHKHSNLYIGFIDRSLTDE